MIFPNINVEGYGLVEAYEKALFELYHFGVEVPCPEWNTSCLEVAANIIINEPTHEPMISGLSICDPYSLEKYRLEMLEGILDWSVDVGLEPYTYHSRMEKQIDDVVNELKRSMDSRRAAVTIRLPSDFQFEDAPCLQHLQFMVRGGELHSFVLFRSNDAVKAAFMNMFALVLLQEKGANKLGVPVGSMIYRANSFHCYERDLKTLNGYVDAILNKRAARFKYRDGWDELMEEENPKILEDVMKQRENRGV